jgi:hypothetical protein
MVNQQPLQPALDGSLPGDFGFDPIGLSNIDAVSLPQIIPPAASMAPDEPLPTIYWMREAELKHGRLAMLAIVGFVTVDSGLHFPGAQYEGLTSVSAHDAMVAQGNMGALFSLIAVIEIISAVGMDQAAKGSGREPGDFAMDPLNYCGTAEGKADMKLKEITHCRLAMLAFGGMVTQAVAVSDQFPYMGLDGKF